MNDNTNDRFGISNDIRGNLVKSKALLGNSEKIHKLKYNGEILYNVLMDDHNKIIVNNLICETLHPKNLVAQLYRHLYSLNPEEQHKLIKKINKQFSQQTVSTNKKQIKMGLI